VDLVVQNTEIAETLNNGQITEIADTPKNRQELEIAKTLNNGHNKEDLLLESAMHEEASQQAAEANTSYGETVIEARKTVINELSLLLQLDEPDLEKSLKDYVPERYHGYLDIFTEKEAIPLLPH
jgi:hypothetical protein